MTRSIEKLDGMFDIQPLWMQMVWIHMVFEISGYYYVPLFIIKNYGWEKTIVNVGKPVR